MHTLPAERPLLTLEEPTARLDAATAARIATGVARATVVPSAADESERAEG